MLAVILTDRQINNGRQQTSKCKVRHPSRHRNKWREQDACRSGMDRQDGPDGRQKQIFGHYCGHGIDSAHIQSSREKGRQTDDRKKEDCVVTEQTQKCGTFNLAYRIYCACPILPPAVCPMRLVKRGEMTFFPCEKGNSDTDTNASYCANSRLLQSVSIKEFPES